MDAVAAAMFVVLALLGGLIVLVPIAFRGVILLSKIAFWLAVLAVACAMLER
jgi:hypothetical protein